jgi:Arc/MetJ-type ribon-helix-helix transcriptional regulator
MTTQGIIKKTFSLTAKDVEIIETVRERCGYVSDSEALRAILRFFYEQAPCLKSASSR